jgi:hypothetical protein
MMIFMERLFLLLTFILCLSAACNSNDAETKEPFSLEEDTVTQAKTVATVADTTKTSSKTLLLEITPEDETDDEVYYQKAKLSSWSSAGITDPIALKKMIKKLQYWAANDMKDSIATVISYPLIHPSIANEQQFIEKYDTYFNTKVKTALANQKLSRLFRSYQGVMLTGGELWFKQKDNRFLISFINN